MESAWTSTLSVRGHNVSGLLGGAVNRLVACPRVRTPEPVPLRFFKAAELRRVPGLKPSVTYFVIRDRLGQLRFLKNPELFPDSAWL